MTTLTLSPPLIDTKAPAKSTESRLAALGGYINDAVRHCGKRDRGDFDFEDMVQVATLEVWKELKDYPDAPIGYIWQVAYRAAIHVLRSGKSVDSLRTDRPFKYQMVSLEALIEHKDGQDTVDDALARRRRHGEIPKPTEDSAVARVMDYELRKSLTPRQEQVLDLRLQQYSESEVAAVLGISQVSVSQHVLKIRTLALAAWGDKPQPPPPVKLTPEEAREKRRARDRQRAKTPQRKEAMKAYKKQQREQINAKRRGKRRDERQKWYARHKDEFNASRRASRLEKYSR